jgi:diguanylate cyclase
MAGMRLDPLCFDVTRFVAADSALSRNALALLTTMIAFGVSAAFFLSLVPDRKTRLQQAPAFAAENVGSYALSSPAAKAPPVAPFDRPKEQDRRQPSSISVEKDGRAREISIDDIFAIRANAHYSYVHDGEQEYFCGLAISAVEARLDPTRFIRVHRSHIVAIDRVASLRRDGENGVAELAAPVRCTIPIARSHFHQVKQMVEARIA